MLRAKHFWLSARAELGVIGKKHARPNRLLNYCSVPNTEGVIISGAHQRHPVRVVRYCVAVEQEDRARDPRTYGLIYTAVNPEHFRPMFLEFLRQSKTSLLNSQGKCAKLMDNNARHNRSSPSVFGLCNTYDNGNEIKTNTSCNLFIYLYKQANIVRIYLFHKTKNQQTT